MKKNDGTMIKEYFNKYECDTDYEFRVKSVGDIENKRFKDEIISLYRSIDDYTEQKTVMDDKLKVRDKQRKKG